MILEISFLANAFSCSPDKYIPDFNIFVFERTICTLQLCLTIDSVIAYSTYSKTLEKVKEFIQKEQSNNNYREVGDKREMPNAEYGTVYLNTVYFDGYEDSELYTEVIIECIKIPDYVRSKINELDELVKEYPQKIPITKVAKFLGVDIECLRRAIEQGRIPFALGCDGDECSNRYTYVS